MKWLNKFFKGSNHKISEGIYPEHYGGPWDYTSGALGEHANSEDLDHAIALSLSEEEIKRATGIGTSAQVDDDEDLARALQASLDIGSPPRPEPTPPRLEPTPPRLEPTPYYPPTVGYPSGYKICAGCNTEIGYGRFLSCMGAFWHPHCFVCRSCGEAISEHEFSMSGNDPYHKSCYKELYHPKCDVCKHFIPTNRAGLIEYRAHPFWGQRYCPSHEHDNTPRCCSCERMEQAEQYILLEDGRKLCLECLDSAIMDTNECQPLYLDIRDFYEGLNMKITQQIPMLLVERQALNEAFQGEKDGTNHMPETRGLCLSEEQTVTSIARRPRIGGNRILDMFTTESQKLTRRCEVTAILILYGLPRLLTGSILAHELMHAWLRLNGYRTLRPEIEEGICQVLSHMWLESEVMAGSGFSDGASTSSASSSSKSKKGVRSKFEKDLGKFFMHQIAMDSSPAYGDGFRAGQAAVVQFGLKRTLDHIRYTGTFP